MYKNLVITVIEDENKLEGVDIKATTYNFIEWMRTAGLDEILQKGEMQDINIENLEGEEFLMKFPAIPRYQFYIHADKEMIESFSTDLKTIGPIDEDFPIGGGWSSGKNFLYLVSPSTILSDIEWRKRDREDIRREDNDKEEDIDMEGNLSKKVRGGTLLDLYVKLLNGFDYFYNHDEEGFWIIA
ncbi:hypothetical protein PVAG01_04478 [Phlyctema vagabunda]|uniref:Uncharacterized protein n=1 Tax=Phlyctema vagabunda TaxID=108571 RepID=A0ABR4PQ12_9HELO